MKCLEEILDDAIESGQLSEREAREILREEEEKG